MPGARAVRRPLRQSPRAVSVQPTPDEPPELRVLPPIDEEIIDPEDAGDVPRGNLADLPPDWRQAWPDWRTMTADQQRAADRYWYTRLGPDERRRMVAAGPEARDSLRASVQALGFASPDEYLATIVPGAMHSGTGDAPAAGMNFLTARELFATVPAETSWTVAGLIPDAALTELDGAAKKAGKTTWVAHLVRAVLDGEPFLGRATRRTAVVVLSEQPVTSLRASFAGAGLLERDDLRILTWHTALGRPWREVAAAAVDAAVQSGAGLLVVDTLPQWAGLRGDAENDAGAALEAIAPLQAAAAAGLTVLLVRHDRKGSGDVGESARGSSAFGGAVDVILQLRRGGPEERSTIRYLSALSRFPDTPEQLVIELRDGGYIELGDAAGYARAEGKLKVLAAVGDRELRRAEIEEQSGVSGERLTEVLADLVATGYLARAGRGVKGDPQRFVRTVPNHSGGSPTTWDPPVGMNSAPVAPDMAAVHVVPADQVTTIACRDYSAHQTQHRQVDGRWVCPSCAAPEERSPGPDIFGDGPA